MPSRDRPRLLIANATLGERSEVWAERQARALRQTGFDPHLLGWTEAVGGTRPPDLPSTLIGHSFPKPTTLWQRGQRKLGLAGAYRLTPAQAQAARAAVSALAPDIVLAHFGWTGIALAQILPPDVPLVIHMHGRDASALLQDAAYRQALTSALARAQAMVAVGAHQVDRLRPLGLPDRVDLIPCGAPLDLFASQPLPEQPQDTGVQFISVGRLSEEKGMRESLAAFARIAADLPHARLVLVGYGPLHDPLEAEIARLGLATRVRLTGRLSPEEIAQELSHSHVYLQHSREYNGWVEGFGVTLTEAGAAGLPLLASRFGGLIDQIVEGENGLLFPTGDVDSQAAVMRQLAQDAPMRARMGARARVLAARFDSDRMAAKLGALLSEVLSGTDAQASGAGG